MSQRDKLIARVQARPPEAVFGDVRRLLELFGWRLARQNSSHVTFTRDGKIIGLALVSGRRVKRVYLDIVCERLGLDD